MAFIHSLFPQCHHQRHLGAELLDLGSDSLADFHDRGDFLIPKEANDALEELETGVDKVLCLGCIELVKGVVEPGVLVLEPVGGGKPEVFIRSELLDHPRYLLVVGGFLFEEHFPRIEFLSVGLVLGEALANGSDVLCDFDVVVHIGVLVEALDGLLQILDVFIELLLLHLHYFVELGFFFLEHLLAGVNHVGDLLRRPKRLPLLIQVLVVKLVHKIVQDVINPHAHKDLLLQPLQLQRNIRHEIANLA